MYLNRKELLIKKRIKQGLCVLTIFLGLWIVFGLYLTLNNSNKQLEELGYSNIEISIIREILNKKEIKNLYNYKYMSTLTDLLVDQDFKSEKLNNYLAYYNKYNNVSNDELIYIINNNFDELEYNEFNMKIIFHKDFDKEKMNRYSDYYNKYKLSIDDVVFAVNNNFDKYNIKYDKKYLDYIKADYFIEDNLERYDKYKNISNNKHKSVDTIISEVNSNLDKKAYIDIKEANYNDLTKILVNKYYYLDSNYEPDNLVDIDPNLGRGKMNQEAYEAYKEMYEDALENNVTPYIVKAYISYNEQSNLYYSNRYYYDRPGFSESQTGLLIELVSNTWLEDNMYKYGFIQRFPDDKKNITGYSKKNYYRYVGKEIAKFIHENNISYEEYYAYFIEKRKTP